MSGKKEAKEEKQKFMIEVLDLYQTLPALWKIKSDDYSNRDKKAQEYEILLKKYRIYFTSAKLEDLKKCINNLRTNFRNELRKMDKSAKSGAGTEDLYVSKSWFMDSMMFLRDQETPAQSRSTMSDTEDNKNSEKSETIQSQDDAEDSTVDAGDSTETEISEGSLPVMKRPKPRPMNPSSSSQISLSGGGRKRKQVMEAEKAELLSLAKARLTEPDDDYLNQAKTWAHELKCIDATQALFAKKAINVILFEARCGTLHRNSVQINCETYTPSSSPCSTPHGSLGNYPFQPESTSSLMSNLQGRHFSRTETGGDQTELSEFFSSFDPNA